jgi:hypothetical protein
MSKGSALEIECGASALRLLTVKTVEAAAAEAIGILPDYRRNFHAVPPVLGG